MNTRWVWRAAAICLATGLLFSTLAPAVAAKSARRVHDTVTVPTLIAVIGDVEIPSDHSILRLTLEDLKKRDLRDVDQLVLDRESYELAVADTQAGRIINSFGTHHPVTILGASPSELGVDGHGIDVPSGSAGFVATTVILSSGTLLESISVWDEESTAEAIEAAHSWWMETRTRYPSDFRAAVEIYNSAEWTLKYSTSYTYTTSPYGVLKYRADFYKSLTEISSTTDSWLVFFDTVTDPGRSVWGNGWRTSQTWITSDVDYYRADHALDQWRPVQQYYGEWISYSTGIGTALMTNAYYSGWNAAVTDTSSSADRFFQIRHDMVYDSNTANLAWTSEPSMLVQVNQGTCIKVPFETRANWYEYSAGTPQQTWITSWRQVCP